MKNNIIEELKNRQLIVQITNEKLLSEILKKKLITVYCGFDPTSDSLHLGHLIPLLCLKHFLRAGHKVVILLGGATGLIGDPSFKNKERTLQKKSFTIYWEKKIKKQILNFFDSDELKNITFVNNYSWFSKINIIAFLRDIGKNFSVNQMINKESVKIRLKRIDQGISFTEFSYNLLQSYDYAHLYDKHNVILQIGGSDQWGNIVSGIDLVRRLHKKQVFGLTLPLILQNSGKKFGKSETNSIWLDAKKTSPYKFYQFWINTPDVDVYRFLKFFTFKCIEEIDIFKEKDKNNKSPKGQMILANYITELVHGKKNLESVKRITKSLFFNEIHKMKKSDFKQLAKDGINTIFLNKNTNLLEALLHANLASSKTQARNMIKSFAIKVNGKKKIKYEFLDEEKIFNQFTILCRGNKHHCLIYWK